VPVSSLMYDFDKVVPRKGTGCFKYDALKMLYGREDLLSLWVADMDFPIAPQIQDALYKRWEHPIHGYNLRLDPFYDAVMHWTEHRYRWKIRKEWIISTPGVVPALNLAILSLTRPGDGIMIQTPVYAPFGASILDHGRSLIVNPLIRGESSWEIDFEDFERKAQQARMFILCNPHNPVGRAFREDELLRMGEICRRNGVTIFSDEIHADIVYPGHRHIPIASLEDFAAITITSFSPAKSFNLAGLATAVTITASRELYDAVNGLNQKLHLYMGNSFGIVALTAAYTQAESWLDALIGYLCQTRDYIDATIRERLPKLITTLPESTYLTWMDFSAYGLSGEVLERFLIDKAGLALDPGSKYGKEYSSFARINFSAPRSIIEEAMSRLAREINSLG